MKAESPHPPPPSKDNPMNYDPTDEARIIAKIKQRHLNLTDKQIKQAIEELIKERVLIRIKH